LRWRKWFCAALTARPLDFLLIQVPLHADNFRVPPEVPVMVKRINWVIAALLLLTLLAGTEVTQASEDADTGDRIIERKTVADLSEIRSRAESMPIDRRIDIDKRVAATVERVNKQAESKGQTGMSARLASELGMSTEALLDEKGKHGFSWGEMVVAETLLANSAEPVKLADLATLRSEGLSWAAIAFGLGFHLEDFEDALKARGKVATSKPKAAETEK
jgi:hypothetical protein